MSLQNWGRKKPPSESYREKLSSVPAGGRGSFEAHHAIAAFSPLCGASHQGVIERTTRRTKRCDGAKKHEERE